MPSSETRCAWCSRQLDQHGHCPEGCPPTPREERAWRSAKQLEKFHLLARLTPAPNTQYVPLAEAAGVIAAEYAALEAEVERLKADRTSGRVARGSGEFPMHLEE